MVHTRRCHGQQACFFQRLFEVGFASRVGHFGRHTTGAAKTRAQAFQRAAPFSNSPQSPFFEPLLQQRLEVWRRSLQALDDQSLRIVEFAGGRPGLGASPAQPYHPLCQSSSQRLMNTVSLEDVAQLVEAVSLADNKTAWARWRSRCVPAFLCIWRNVSRSAWLKVTCFIAQTLTHYLWGCYLVIVQEKN